MEVVGTLFKFDGNVPFEILLKIEKANFKLILISNNTTLLFVVLCLYIHANIYI